MRAVAIAIAVLMSAISTTSTSSAAAGPPRVILPAEKLTSVSIDDWGQRAEPPYWTPSQEEIAAAEARLPKALGALGERERNIADQLHIYGRQYFGVTIDGRRTLVVNAFCRGWEKAKLTEQVFKVWDGGYCYFTAYYDPVLNQFKAIAVNAEG